MTGLRRVATGFVRRRYAVAAVDQIAISLFNFALTFALVRLLSASEFGTFGLWIAVANLAISVQAALVCTPLSVHAVAETDEAKRRGLEEALGSVNLLLIVATILAIGGVNAFSDAEWAPRDLLTLAAIPLFIGAGLYREYYRSVAFGQNDMTLLLLVDLPYVAATLACIGAMLLWPQSLGTLGFAFLGLTLGGIAAQVCGGLRVMRLRLRLLRKGWVGGYKGVFREVLWQLSGVMSTHVQGRSYNYIATGLVGLADLATINAVAFLFRPGQLMLIAWRRSALPQLARLHAAGQAEAFDRRVLGALAVALAVFATWCTVLWIGWGEVDRYFFVGKYPGAYLLLLPWAIAVGLDTIGSILSTALQAAREFRFLAYVTIVSAPITVVATVALTLWRGYTWTIYGLAIGGGVGVTMAVVRLLRIRHRAVISGMPAGDPAARGMIG